MAGIGDYLVSDLHHCLIYCLGISSHFKCAIFVNVRESKKHIRSWYSYLVKHDPAVIFGVVSKFCTKISDLDSSKWGMSLHISYGYDECLNAVLVFINKTFCKYKRVVCPKS